MPTIDFPVNPIRKDLYSWTELYSNFDKDNEDSLVDTLDFMAYFDFKKNGGSFPNTYFNGMMRSLHDFSIWNGVLNITKDRMVIAIMGGHEMERDPEGPYAKIAKISFLLTQKGYLLTSGGGPGAMEATHLGAYFSNYSQKDLDEAINILSLKPKLPKDLSNLIKDNVINKKILKELHDWIRPTFEIIEKYSNGGESLSLPTWLYGYEPTSPFAMHIAKYFQNSIREDGLLAIAKYGVIYTEGKAGTIQEIFQDATQNYYISFDCFSPMVFFDQEYWTKKYPVKIVLDNLFLVDDNKKYLKYTDNVDEVVNFLCAFRPPIK